MSELRDRIAEAVTDAVETVLGAHDFSVPSGQCSCGLRNNMDGDVLDLHRISLIGEAVRNALAIPGIAVVELPEPDDPAPPDEDERLRPPLAQWGGESGADFLASVWHLGEVQISQYVRHGWYEPMEPISPADARQFALALLAAAEYAEREQ